MKICILTQPLGTNYGGLLQTYALQTVLKRLGHDVWTEDRRPNNIPLYRSLFNKFKTLIGPMFGIYYPTKDQQQLISTNTSHFISEYIHTTEPIYSKIKTEFIKYSFDAYIVGSDQVWRPRYSPYLLNYFLDFTKNINVKRIAYAASFGTDQWEFTDNQTKTCAELAKKFDAISVREASGVDLCRKFLGVNAVQVLDPTLLLDKDDYLKFCKADSDGVCQEIFYYFLDETNLKLDILNKYSEKLRMSVFTVMPKRRLTHKDSKYLKEHINEFVFPGVDKWLGAFHRSKFIVTDSFHGCAFSIIFNKEFVVVKNDMRGNARLESLLRLFNLEERLITEYSPDTLNPINWAKVNEKRQELRVKSLSFLNYSL